MTKTKPVRWAKGAAVSAVAAGACYAVWTVGREWAQGVRQANPDAILAGSAESVMAVVAGVALMPVLLWAGMRAVRERGNHLLVIAGTVVWLFVGGHVVENAVSTAGTAAFLALFAVLGGLLAMVEVRGSGRPTP
ncbi:hypothetical protein [Streptomyces sp. NPDC000410]|uniref:hypothetical protein n=1 Tax=Streptomyces sp. NPDC000410 TaxID=3154254 RepID=UPI003327007F